MPNYRIQYRRDTAENWQSVNPILLDGEVGYEITDQEGVLLTKVGDGVMGADGTITGTHWNDLPYVSGPIGPAPEHEWQETSLRFRKPNGVWGDYVNLQGPQGNQGIQGEQGEPGPNVPATKSSLGSIIVGKEFDITQDGCLSPSTMLANREEYITESGNWTAKATGWHEVTVIGGGSGLTILTLVAANNCPINVVGGVPGDRVTRLVWLEKDQVVPVVIGAGSPNKTGDIVTINGYAQPTVSSFGDIQTYRYWEYDALPAEEKRVRSYESCLGAYAPRLTSYDGVGGEYVIQAPAYGIGGGSGFEASVTNNGRAYGGGAGGGVTVRKNASGVWQVVSSSYGQSKQGCVIVRWFESGLEQAEISAWPVEDA